MRTRTLLAVLAAAALSLAAAPGQAMAADCSYPAAYPGDSAPREAIAGWMAGGAQAAGLPGELPVMASLTDAGLKNLGYGDADAVGYFAMRTAIWNTGAYAGFPEHPSLQLQWFIDQAQAVRQHQVALGNTQYGVDPAGWGEWVADVQRPASQYRGRYQLHLDEARSLVALGCVPSANGGTGAPAPGSQEPPPATTPAEPDLQLIPDSILPALSVAARRYQDAARSKGLVATARCSNESCFTRAAGKVAVANRGIYALSAPPQKLKTGQRGTFTLPLGRRLARLVAAARKRGQCPLGVVRIVAANAGGYRISASRTIMLGPSAQAC